MAGNTSELLVITKAKDLCSYIMTVTQKSPKQFRFTFVRLLQNLRYVSLFTSKASSFVPQMLACGRW